MNELLRKQYGPIEYVLYRIEEERGTRRAYEWICQVQGAAECGIVAASQDEIAICAVEWAWAQHALGILREGRPLRATLSLERRAELIREIECELAWMQHEAIHARRPLPAAATQET